MDARLARSETRVGAARTQPLSPKLVGDLLRLADICVLLSLGVGIYFAYVHPHEPHVLPRYLASFLAAGLIASVMFNNIGVYGGDFVFTKGLRTERMISALAVTFALLLAIAFALKVSTFYSRVWAVSWFVSSGLTLTLCRLALGRWIWHQAEQGSFANRTVIVGTGEQARRLAAHLRGCDAVHTRIVGLIDLCEDLAQTGLEGLPVLGGLDDLVHLIRTGAVDQVFLALPWSEVEPLRAVLERLTVTPVTLRLAPDLAGFDFIGKSFTQVAGLPVLHLFDRPISEWAYVMKTVEDRVIAAFCLLVLGLPILLIAILIKLDSPGPVLFRQRRHGFNNTTIEVWKFRTMHADQADPDGREQARRDDPRVTRFGRLLRRTSLDELPQLINVLRGEMSIVGPRPHALGTQATGYLFEEVVDRYAARHRVKPGITGWAQVNGWRGETDTVDKLEKRVEYDLYYIDNWSIWLDLWIIARTLKVPFRDHKAY